MFTKEMQRALKDDGEKLRQLTGKDHGPVFPVFCPAEYADCFLPECAEHGCMCDKR